MRSRSIALALFSLACGPSQDKFEADFAEEVCGWLDDCELLGAGGFDKKADCVKVFESTWNDEDCEYDRKSATDCVDEVQQLTCDDGLESAKACDLVCE